MKNNCAVQFSASHPKAPPHPRHLSPCPERLEISCLVKSLVTLVIERMSCIAGARFSGEAEHSVLQEPSPQSHPTSVASPPAFAGGANARFQHDGPSRFRTTPIQGAGRRFCGWLVSQSFLRYYLGG